MANEVIQQSETQRQRVQIVKLDRSWAPWRYQVNRFALDGKDYGRPLQATLYSQSNYGTLTAARAAFNAAYEGA